MVCAFSSISKFHPCPNVDPLWLQTGWAAMGSIPQLRLANWLKWRCPGQFLAAERTTIIAWTLQLIDLRDLRGDYGKTMPGKLSPTMAKDAERIAMLRAIFDCSEQVAAKFGQLVHWNKVPRSGVVAHQGDMEGNCHVIVSGTADMKVLGTEGQYIQIATVEPGEIFGNYPVAAPNRADILARDRLELVSIEAAQLAQLALDHAEVGAGLSSIFARQLGNVLDRFAARVTLTANGRVYANLLRLADDQHQIRPNPVVAAIALQAQTTRETASRAISSLERRGILEKGADGWTILAPRMLEDMVI